jgi:uncharacterized protein
VLAGLRAVGKPPRSALLVTAEEVFTHCPKAFVRSELWDPASWPDPAAAPSAAEVLHAHVADPELTLAEVERSQVESLRDRLA